MAEEKELTEEAKKQRRKREKAAAKDAALGVEKFTVEVAGVFKPDLKRVMAAHSINNQQDIHQRLLTNLIAADFETQAWMLRGVTTPYVVSEKVLRQLKAAGLLHLSKRPGEPDDEIISPEQLKSDHSCYR
ncbi:MULTISPECIES: hypothetical protein [unclassified Pseudomonas]|uniref:hypothetical protein n=1 Tax=unclassified Pseudomonas TaxID=196821 RepID=UPI001B33CF25|nr:MULTISPECIES: hypothetical protein [unclassified Pseudomonas]MBP5948209.1 hypothetical protein [Pseudomonas sp. P9(2020)]MBZ9560708.1 hypothetical protein [Pseudomonas sp. P116]